MELITQIIDILSDENTNLENALIKSKVLLHRLGERESVEWINKELNGYSEQDEIPEYRVLISQPKVTASNGFTIWKEMPAVTGHLTDRQIENLTISKWRDPIASIEHFTGADGDTLSSPIPPEFWSKLSEGLQKGIHVEHAHCVISKSQVLKIKTVIRSRLLDFVLKLEEKFPDDTVLEDIKSSPLDIGNLLNNTMFGDHATIIIGDYNTQNVSTSIVKNDLESLVSFLSSKGISDNDTKDLVQAIEIDGDDIDFENEKPGSKVSEWMKKMLGKAVDATWQINVGAAGGVLAAAIAEYYGFG
ncbi:MAG: response regulator receiver protein [Pseudomonadota bacterium]